MGWITNLSWASCHKPRWSRAPTGYAFPGRLVDTSPLPLNLERLGTSASIAGCRQEMAPRPEMSVDYKSLKCGTNPFAFENGQGAVFSSMSAAFSPIMIDGALVLPDVSVGMIEASAIRRPVMP